MRDYNGMILITKEERIIGSPFCLRLGSSCGNEEWAEYQASLRNALKDQSEGYAIFNTL